MVDKVCLHKDQIKDFSQKEITVCEECIKVGDAWVNLRQCFICGHVGCCDSSKNKHATKHFKATKHPIMKSVTPGEEFTWCYVDTKCTSSFYIKNSHIVSQREPSIFVGTTT